MFLRLRALVRLRSRKLTIRRRLFATFVVINVLFALNVALYLWSNARRKDTITDLREAVVAEKTITDIRQSLNNIQRQITLLSEAMDGAIYASAEEIAQFKKQLQSVQQMTASLGKLSKGEDRKRADTLAASYAKLSASWLIFYEDYGVRQTAAIMEMAMHAEPLSQEILDHQVPALLEDEKRHVEVATANFNQVGDFTDRVTPILFMLSGLIAAANFYLLSRYLTRALEELRVGAHAIGAGELDRVIEIHSRDEVGDLASTFNDMAKNLSTARSQLTSANSELESRNQEIDKQRHVSESLLLNILPSQIANELRLNKSVEPKYFEDVTILFTDFVGFTLSTEQLAAEDLVHRLNDYFTAFDQITARYGIEKLKTIGDAYMCVAGMPVRSPSHPVDMVLAAFEMVQAVEELSSRPGYPNWKVRVGIHTGPVISGVVGIHKFAFDIWGESVNYSARMESSGSANRVNISERTHSRVKDFIACEHRGKIATKEKREFDMYFAEGVLPELMGTASDDLPLAFVRRYRTYFQKDPLAFPGFLAGRRGVEDMNAGVAKYTPSWW